MAVQGHGAEQLKMFMSSREILGRYQPLDADRLGSGETGYSFGSKDVPTPSNSTIGSVHSGIRSNIRGGFTESDSEVWERKAEEGEYQYEPSMQDMIVKHGVMKPVHLSQQFGSMGKPMVAGGHHRIAASNDVDPDRLMPVLHHATVGKARQPGAYPYS